MSRTKAWYGDEDIIYKFPKNCELKIFSPKTSPVLSKSKIQKKILNPICSEPLSSILKSNMKICIISDDISRPTRTDSIIPILIKILKANGISLENIRIAIASGMHSQMDYRQKLLKFGHSVLNSVKIIDHSYKKNLVYLGRTTSGTPVYINKYVSESDLVIGVGGIYPHNNAGFGGGAKLILGVSGIKTIKSIHSIGVMVGRGGSTTSKFRKELLEVARLSRLNYIINNLLSKDREIIDIFAGDVQEAFLTGAKKARSLYSLSVPKRFSFDLVIADTYPFDNDLVFSRKGWWPLLNCNENAHRLIISALPEGIGFHALFHVLNRPQRLLNQINQVHQMRNFFAKETFQMVASKLKSSIWNFIYKINKTSFLHPLVLFHSQNSDPIVSISHMTSTNNFERYISRIQRSIGNKNIKVGYYQASSLTFPEDRHPLTV
jgi:nickel-dependent lactate racemase